MNKKISKRSIFLLIYALIIIVLLIYILFIAPDSLFSKKQKDQVEQRTFTDYNIQKKNLMNKQYDYDYDILYGNTVYNCSGTLNNNKESGTCTKPEQTSYDEKTKKEIYSDININNLDVAYIFKQIENIQPTENKYGSKRSYTYKLVLDKYSTEIIIYTNYDDITEIQLSNAYEVYDLKFTNILYWL